MSFKTETPKKIVLQFVGDKFEKSPLYIVFTRPFTQSDLNLDDVPRVYRDSCINALDDILLKHYFNQYSLSKVRHYQ